MRMYSRHIALTLILFALDLGTTISAQLSSIDPSQFSIGFMIDEIEFKKNEIVSNPIRIVNNSNQTAQLHLDVSAPPGWFLMKTSKREFSLAAGDSIFIPTRLIPKGGVEGSTKYSINAMVRTEDGLPLGVGSFFCFTKKVVKWEMKVGPDDLIYFKNDEDEARFDLTLKNKGNYKQDFQLTLNGGQREDLLLHDTIGNVVRRPTFTLDLDANQDTTLAFSVRPVQFKRNFRTVSTISHRPFTITAEKRFRYYAISEEAKDLDHSSVKRGNKIDFVRLSNERTVSPYGSDHLPLTVEARIQNILSDFSIMSLNLQGMKQIDQDSRLVYFTQLFFSQNFYNRNLLDRTPWYVGYFKENWDVQVGNVNGRSIGNPASGKGITGSYKLNEQHRIGGHFTLNPGFNDTRLRSYGVYHDYISEKNVRVNSTLSRNEDLINGQIANIASTRISTRITQNQNISVMGAYSLNTFTDTSITKSGYMLGGSYSSIMLDRKLRTTLTGQYTSPSFGTASAEQTNLSNRTIYNLNEIWDVQLFNNYNHTKRYSDVLATDLYSQYLSFNNRLSFAAKTDKGIFQPGAFYNILDQPMFELHSRGLTFNYSLFNMEKNTMVSTSLQGAYNNPKGMNEIKDYFTANISLLTRVSTLSMNLRYMYGPGNPLLLQSALSQFAYPKQFRASLQQQHVFRNSRFVLQSGVNYSYANQTLSHSINLFPELFYFSATGWRFSVNASYNYLSSDVQRATAEISQNLGVQRNDTGPSTSTTMRMGLSLRKDIGIPIPFSKAQNFDIDIISFYDLNGNGVREKDEPTIENVVIRLDKEEVLTNVKGEAGLKNMPGGSHMLTVTPLDAPEGWFAGVADSLDVITDMTLNVPFVRGIKVSGQVVIDLDQRTTTAGAIFDLTNIKIAAYNGKAYHTLTDLQGRFDFYLPNGDYTITLDENILTDKYRLMQNDISVSLSNELENMFVTFFIVEKRRKVNVKKFGE